MNDNLELKRRIAWLGGQVQKHATIAADSYETASFFQAEKERLERQIGESDSLARVGDIMRQYEATGRVTPVGMYGAKI